MNAADLLALFAGREGIEYLQISAALQLRSDGQLALLIDQVVRAVRAKDIEGARSRIAQRRRIAKTSAEIAGLAEPRINVLRNAMRAEMSQMAELKQRRFEEGFAALLPGVGARIPKLGYDDLLKAPAVMGATTEQYLAQLENNIVRDLTATLNRAALRGLTTAEIIAEIRGRPTGGRIAVQVNQRRRTVPQFTGGALASQTSQTATWIRTAVFGTASLIGQLQVEANDDSLRGYQAVTILDGHTSVICLARTGSGWFTDGTPFPDSSTDEPFPGFPPWHHGCRTQLAIVIRSFEGLEDRLSGARKTALSRLSPEEKARLDGNPAAEIKDAASFLRNQSAVDVKKQLGVTKYQLWRDGKISLSQLIDQTGRPRTARELMREAG